MFERRWDVGRTTDDISVRVTRLQLLRLERSSGTIATRLAQLCPQTEASL